MSTRFGWLLGAAVLVGMGVLVACGTSYHSSSDGLVLVSSQGSAVVESFSFSLASGRISGISNPPSDTGSSTCILPGLPGQMVIDPAGAYAYVVMTNPSNQCSGGQPGIASFKVNSDGTVGALGTVMADPNPVQLVMDPSGKFLFVAEGMNSQPNSTSQFPNPQPCPGTTAQFGICTYAISNGTMTPVSSTPFVLSAVGFTAPNIVAVAPSYTVFPKPGLNGLQNSVCGGSGNTAPTEEFLYAADSVNNVVWEFSVDTSTGAISFFASQPWIAAGSIPSGVAVDPCDRFVYASNSFSNNVSGYTICLGTSSQSQSCPGFPDGTLFPITGSPFSLTGGANGPGQVLVDPFGLFVYVLETKSNQISPFKIATVSGSLTAQSVVATGLQPTSMALRSDDSWMFVTNFNAASLSYYSVTPGTGALSPQPTIQTDNYPFGVAVK